MPVAAKSEFHFYDLYALFFFHYIIGIIDFQPPKKESGSGPFGDMKPLVFSLQTRESGAE